MQKRFKYYKRDRQMRLSHFFVNDMVARLVKVLVFVLSLSALLFGVFLLYFTLNDYKPALKDMFYYSSKYDTLRADAEFSVVSWNIGYAGLDKDMDFFYDGGTLVRPTEEKSAENLSAILNFLKGNDNADFFLLQEVDVEAKRSYYKNQVDYLKNNLGCYDAYFALNYNVKYVPLPVFEPVGFVKSGLATFCKHKPFVCERNSFPFNFDWPVSVFMLDRCFLVSRFHLSNGKEFVLVNTHNSAFDDGGEIRKAETEYFCSFLNDEYSKGNYVVVGGDFNQCPARFNPSGIKNFDYKEFYTVSDSLLEDWHFVFDDKVPSNRRVVAPFDPEKTKVTVIDFFLTSPNVRSLKVETIDLKFSNSDHNPVKASFVLD